MKKLALLAGLAVFGGMIAMATLSLAYASPAIENTQDQVNAPEQPQQVSGQLETALQAIAGTGVPELTQIVGAVRAQGTILVFDDEVTLAPGCTLDEAWAMFAPPRAAVLCGLQRSPYIVLSSSLRRYPDGSLTPPKTLATLLVHEGYHLREDLVLNSPARDSFSCLAHEFHAESSVALYWDTIWPNNQYPSGMPNPQIDLEEEYNALLQAFRSGDSEQVGRVINVVLRQYFTSEDAPCRPARQSEIPGEDRSTAPSPPYGPVPNGYSSTIPQAAHSGNAPMVGAPPRSNEPTASTAQSSDNPWRSDQDDPTAPLKQLSSSLDSIFQQMRDHLRSYDGAGMSSPN